MTQRQSIEDHFYQLLVQLLTLTKWYFSAIATLLHSSDFTIQRTAHFNWIIKQSLTQMKSNHLYSYPLMIEYPQNAVYSFVILLGFTRVE